MLTQYDPKVFDALDDLDDASRRRLKEEETKLPHLGNVILRHNLDQQVGVYLLHRHFELSHDERLVERFIGNRSFAVPLNVDEAVRAVPYTWKAVKNFDSEGWNFYPLEFVECPESIFFEKVTQNEAFFADMANELSEMGVTDVFGVSILHRSAIKLAEGEILLETSNKQERRLNFSAVSKNKIESTQTLWAFKPSEDGACGQHECGNHCCWCCSIE